MVLDSLFVVFEFGLISDLKKKKYREDGCKGKKGQVKGFFRWGFCLITFK